MYGINLLEVAKILGSTVVSDVIFNKHGAIRSIYQEIIKYSARKNIDMVKATILRPLFWVLVLAMAMTASIELGPNRWIPAVLESAGIHGILVLVWINLLMAILRYKAGPVVHKLSPTGILVSSRFSVREPISPERSRTRTNLPTGRVPKIRFKRRSKSGGRKLGTAQSSVFEINSAMVCRRRSTECISLLSIMI